MHKLAASPLLLSPFQNHLAPLLCHNERPSYGASEPTDHCCAHSLFISMHIPLFFTVITAHCGTSAAKARVLLSFHHFLLHPSTFSLALISDEHSWLEFPPQLADRINTSPLLSSPSLPPVSVPASSDHLTWFQHTLSLQ